MGKNNRQVKIGEDKVFKKLYKAKTKWVIQGGVFGALIFGTAFGMQSSDTYAAENDNGAATQVSQMGSVKKDKVVTLTTTAPTTATAASTTPDATPESTTTPAPTKPATPAATTASAPTPAAMPAATTTPAGTKDATPAATTTSAPDTTTTATQTTTVPETAKTSATKQTDDKVLPPVGSEKGGNAAAVQAVAAEPITLTGKDAKDQFQSVTPVKDFDDQGIIQLTDNHKGQSASASLNNRIDMTQNFELTGQINAGIKDGADGMSIGLHYGDIGKGGDANAVGIGGLENTFGFKVDSFSNLASDADLKKADVKYGVDPMDAPFAGFVSADNTANHKAITYNDPNNKNDPANAQAVTLDNSFKKFAMSYTAADTTLKVEYDGKTWTKDIKDWVDKDNKQFWNLYISASTGMKYNEQSFKLDSLNYTPEFAAIVKYVDEGTGQQLIDTNKKTIQPPVKYVYDKDAKTFSYTVQTPAVSGYVYDDLNQTAPLTGTLDETNRTTAVTVGYVDITTASIGAKKAIDGAAQIKWEQLVAPAQTALTNELKNGSATISSINQAVKTLTDVTAVEAPVRAGIVGAANTAITNANSFKMFPNVAGAIDAVNGVLADASAGQPTGLNINISAVTAALTNELTNAKAIQDTANSALTGITPVSNETEVVTAMNALKTALGQSTVDVANIQTTTTSLADVVAKAKASREDAKIIANAEITNAASEITEPGVVTALDNLNRTIAAADADDSRVLTQQVIDATADLKAKAATAAKNSADNVVTAASPVNNEPTVLIAKTDLNNVINKKGVTAADIATAAKSFTDVANQAKNLRNVAKLRAGAELTNAASENANPDVATAISTLMGRLSKADADAADPVGMTKLVNDATSELKTKVVAAAKGNAGAAVQAAKPVTNEPDVLTAAAALDTVVNKKDVSAAEIEAAVKIFAGIADKEKIARDDVKTAATTAIDDAAGEKTDPDVATAITTLNDLTAKADADDPAGLTEQVRTATGDLKAKVVIAAKNSADKIVNDAAPVSHEPDVLKAKTALDNVVNKSGVTAAEIEAAAKAFDDLADQVKITREDAKTAAKTAIDDAASESQEPVVAAAINHLNDVLAKADADDAAGLTDLVKTATTDLQIQAVGAATSTANDAIKAAKPVSNEADVLTAKAALDTALTKQNATAAEIATAIQSFTGAAEKAKIARDDAKTAATIAINDAASEGQDKDVTTAIAVLNTLMANADADSPAVLTDFVNAATTDLKTKVISAATNAANDAIKDAAPVSNEPDVQTAKAALGTALKNGAKVTQIETATKALADAVKMAKGTRDDIKTKAQTAISDAASEGHDDDVAAAIKNLNDILAKADADDPTGVTQEVTDAVIDLQGKVVVAAKNAADKAVQSLAPVSHEPDVIAAKKALDTVTTKQDASAAEIEAATTTLKDVAAKAKGNRDDATIKAQAEIANAASEGKDEGVRTAIAVLNTLMANADKDSPVVLTDFVKAATSDLQTKVVKAARGAANDALKSASPVSYEPEMITAKSNFEGVLNKQGVTAGEIEAATTTFADTATKAKGLRDDAKITAANVINDAASLGNAAVTAAITNLNDLIAKADADNPDGVTQKVNEATAKLQTQAIAAATDLADAAVKAASPVSNESEVLQAKTDLNSAVNKQGATATDIKLATEAFADAATKAKGSRDDAKIKAQDEIDKAAGKTNSGDVATAITNLKELMAKADKDDPAGLTQKVVDATGDLQTKVIAATKNAADAAVKAASPVSNEADVLTAKKALEAASAKQDATAAEIEAATKVLSDATEQAKIARDGTKAAAEIAIDDAASEGTDTAVKAAIKSLNELMAKADADNPAGLTQKVADATSNLQSAVVAAAKSDAGKVVKAATPVSNEPDVLAAKKDLDVASAKDDATAAEIEAATKKFADVTEAAKIARDDAKGAAEIAIDDAASEGTDTAVKAAIKTLNELMAKADADDPAGLTQKVADATSSLQSAVVAAAKNVAGGVVKAAMPVSNEPDVLTAKKALDATIADKDATAAEVETATKDFVDATSKVKIARDDAKKAAVTAINDAASEGKDTAVKAAIKSLNELMAKADADDPAGVTQKIIDAKDDLQAKVVAAAMSQAGEAVKAAAPVGNEPDVLTAKQAVDSAVTKKDATAAEIEAATKNLVDATAKAITAREDASAKAQAEIKNAAGQSQDDDVAAAINHLNDVLAKAATGATDGVTDLIIAATGDLQTKVAIAAQNAANRVSMPDTLQSAGADDVTTASKPDSGDTDDSDVKSDSGQENTDESDGSVAQSGNTGATANGTHTLSDTAGGSTAPEVVQVKQTAGKGTIETTVTDQSPQAATNKQAELPQTSDETNLPASLIGLIMMSLLGLVGVNKRRKNN